MRHGAWRSGTAALHMEKRNCGIAYGEAELRHGAGRICGFGQACHILPPAGAFGRFAF